MSTVNEYVTFIILTILAISTILNLITRFLPMPLKLQKLFNSRDIEILRSQVPDILAKLRYYECIGIEQELPKYKFTEVETTLKEIVLDSVEPGEHLVGKLGKTKIRNFVNLRKKLLDPCFAEYLADLFFTALKSKSKYSDNLYKSISNCSAICCHRTGSFSLAYEVAKKLKKPLVVISDETYIKSQRNEIQVEGIIPQKNSEVIFVDDSTTNGRMIKVSADVIKERYELKLTNAILIFYREEGKAKEDLMAHGIQIHPLLELNDDKIEALNKKRN